MNLFMHYAFDSWMKRTYPRCPFARYADDAVVHCRIQAQAEAVMRSIALRLEECGLTMHPEKSKIVYCKDSKRTGAFHTCNLRFWASRSGPGERAVDTTDYLPASCRR
jgi:retron-type reverse transcriptase